MGIKFFLSSMLFWPKSTLSVNNNESPFVVSAFYFIRQSKDALFYRRHDTLSAPSGALQLLGGEVAWLYGISLEAIIKT